MATKTDSILAWRKLAASQDPLPVMKPIPYQVRGSRYGTCGIRIDGSPEFIDAVLSNLKSLLDGENNTTRLELSRSKVHKGFKKLPLADENAECCYVRLHQRGKSSVGRVRSSRKLLRRSSPLSGSLPFAQIFS